MFPERILVVDDDPLVPSIARAHFLTNGVSVCDIASNGRHALELFLASESTYDLIVCDISMPEVDGIELISALHRKGYTGWLGVITSQHPTLGRTALNIAKVMECAPQASAASRLTGKPSTSFSRPQGMVTPGSAQQVERTTSLPSMNCARPWTKTG
jgi:CheY-like chemotaxis protein